MFSVLVRSTDHTYLMQNNTIFDTIQLHLIQYNCIWYNKTAHSYCAWRKNFDIKAITRGPPGGLQILNTMGPPVTWFQNDSRISEMKLSCGPLVKVAGTCGLQRVMHIVLNVSLLHSKWCSEKGTLLKTLTDVYIIRIYIDDYDEWL